MIEAVAREGPGSSELTDQGRAGGHREALDGIARLAAEGLGSAATLVSVLGTGRPFLRTEVGLPLEMIAGRETPLLDSLCLEVAAHRGPLLIADADLAGAGEVGRVLRKLRLRSCMGIALIREDQPALGSLCAVADTPRRWSRTEVDLFTELAALAAAEVRANAPSPHSGGAPELGSLRPKLNLAFAGAGSLQDTLGAATEAVCRDLSWDVGCAWLVEGHPEDFRCVAQWQRQSAGLEVFAEICSALRFRGDKDVVGAVRSRKRPAWSPDLSRVEGFSRSIVASAADLRCGAWIPILAGERALGTLELLGQRPRPEHERIAPHLLELGRQIGGLVALRQPRYGVTLPAAVREAQGPFRGLPDASWS